MVGSDGKVCLIDPAVYYGHREIELSFTQMFGGFDHSWKVSPARAVSIQKQISSQIVESPVRGPIRLVMAGVSLSALVVLVVTFPSVDSSSFITYPPWPQ